MMIALPSFYSTVPAIDIEYSNLTFVQMHHIYLEAANELILGDNCESCIGLLSVLNLPRCFMLDQTNPQPFASNKEPSVTLM